MSEDVKQKIVFQMDTKGTAKAAKDVKKVGTAAKTAGAGFKAMLGPIALVVAALAGAAIVFNKMYDSSLELNKQLQSLNTDMSRFNEQTNGLIDTNTGFVAAIELQNAGLKATKEQMGALGVAAVDMNRKLGGDEDGATKIFKQLVDSVKTAKVKGLQEFGIELSQTGDKTLAAQEALGKLVDKFGNLELKAANTKEEMYAFNNSFGTIQAAEFNGALAQMSSGFDNTMEAILGTGDSFGELSAHMASYEDDIVATRGTIAQYMWTMDGISLRTDTWIQKILGNKHAVAELNDEYRKQVDTLAKIQELQDRKKSLKTSQQLTQDFLNAEIGSQDQRIAGRRLQGELRGKLSTELNTQQKIIMTAQSGGQSFLDMDFSDPIKATSESSGKVKAGKAAKQDSFEFSIDEINASQSDLLSRPTPFTTSEFSGADINDVFSGVSSELQSGAGASAGAAGAAAQSAAGAAAVAAANRVELQRSTLNTMLGLERQYMAESVRMSEQTNRQRAESVENMTASVSSSLSNLSKATNANSRKGFDAMKAMSYASNAIDTISGSTAAFRSVMQTVPFPLNTILAPLAAGSVAAMGAANGRKIRQQKFGGGSTPSTASSSASFPSGGSLSGGSASQPDNYVINVKVDGNTIHKSMMNANDFANQSGEKHFTTDDN